MGLILWLRHNLGLNRELEKIRYFVEDKSWDYFWFSEFCLYRSEIETWIEKYPDWYKYRNLALKVTYIMELICGKAAHGIYNRLERNGLRREVTDWTRDRYDEFFQILCFADKWNLVSASSVIAFKIVKHLRSCVADIYRVVDMYDSRIDTDNIKNIYNVLNLINSFYKQGYDIFQLAIIGNGKEFFKSTLEDIGRLLESRVLLVEAMYSTEDKRFVYSTRDKKHKTELISRFRRCLHGVEKYNPDYIPEWMKCQKKTESSERSN